jgi:hypothetical protein
MNASSIRLPLGIVAALAALAVGAPAASAAGLDPAIYDAGVLPGQVEHGVHSFTITGSRNPQNRRIEYWIGADRWRQQTTDAKTGELIAGPSTTPAARPGCSGFDAQTVVGASSSTRVVFAAGGTAESVELAIFCRVPDAQGSVRAAPAAAADALVVHPCRQRAALSVERGGRLSGTVTSREPLAVLAGSRGWLRVKTDAGRRGWIRATVAC